MRHCSKLRQRPGDGRQPVQAGRGQSGVTLIELVISIVIIGIAATAILQSLGYLTVQNVDPMLRGQNLLVAQSLMDETLGKPYFDPDEDPREPGNSNDPTVCPTPETVSSRSQWDNVCDLDGYASPSAGVTTPQGTAISGLENYAVSVAVDDSDGLSLNGMANQSGCTPRILKITVTATDPRGQVYSLIGYRTSYWSDTKSGCPS